MCGRKGRRGRTGKAGSGRRIGLVNGPGEGERFLARRSIDGGGLSAVEELVVKGLEGGDGAADDKTAELGPVWIENGQD